MVRILAATILPLLVFAMTACGNLDEYFPDASETLDSTRQTYPDELDFAAAIDSVDSVEDAIETSQADSLFGPDSFCVPLRDPLTITESVCIPLAFTTTDGHSSWCYPGGSCVTSAFGQRRRGWHYGNDVRLKIGDTIRAAFAGEVRFARPGRRGYGNAVVIRHDNGLETLYAHLHTILVTNNQRVMAGECIGLGGNSGHSSGPHLHFEVRYCGRALNPNTIFNFRTHTLKSDTLLVDNADFAYLVEMRRAKYCVIRRGDTLSGLARRHGTTVKSICRLNDISTRTKLQVGRKVRYQ